MAAGALHGHKGRVDGYRLTAHSGKAEDAQAVSVQTLNYIHPPGFFETYSLRAWNDIFHGQDVTVPVHYHISSADAGH